MFTLTRPDGYLLSTDPDRLDLDRVHHWLSTDAYDSGNDAEGDQYGAWSDDLAGRADMMLEAEGNNDDAITALRDAYDSRVVDEMGKPGAKYDVTTCPDLVVSAAN